MQCRRSYGVKYIADTQIIKVLEYFQSVKRVAARYAFSLCATKYTYCMCLKKKFEHDKIQITHRQHMKPEHTNANTHIGSKSTFLIFWRCMKLFRMHCALWR